MMRFISYLLFLGTELSQLGVQQWLSAFVLEQKYLGPVLVLFLNT